MACLRLVQERDIFFSHPKGIRTTYLFQEELILFSFVKGGVRARGAKGGLPQIFEPPSFWRQQEKIGVKPVFKDVFMFFYYYYFFIFFLCFMYFLFLLLFYYFSCFLNFNLKSA